MPGIYDTKTMLPVINEQKRPKTFLKDLFFPNRETFNTAIIEVDIVKDKRTVAPFCSPVKNGVVMKKQGFNTSQFEAPNIHPKMPITAEELLKRQPGENCYSAKSPAERAMEQQGKDFAKLDDMIARREEIMCRDALIDGKVLIAGDDVQKELDFGGVATVILSGTDLWSDKVNSDPLGDLEDWKIERQQLSGINPTVVVMDPKAAKTFKNHPKVLDALDVKNVELGIIKPQELPNGATYIGRIASLGLDLYSYAEWYEDETGTEVPMLTEGLVLMGSTVPEAEFEIRYGAVVRFENKVAVLYEAERVPVIEEKDNVQYNSLISRPVPIPRYIDSLVVAHVL
jgi:hypothetical protein